MCDGSVALIQTLLFFNHFYKRCHQNTTHRLHNPLSARQQTYIISKRKNRDIVEDLPGPSFPSARVATYTGACNDNCTSFTLFFVSE